MSDLTIAEKLLLASVEERKDGEPFSAEDLVVQSWKMYPDTFGLAGYADDYPDSNRVLTNIMGSKGMRGKGWIQKVGQKQYRVTSEGLSEAAQIAKNEGSDDDERKLRAELSRDVSKSLRQMMDTKAARKILNGDIGSLSFYDACGFWDITARSNARTLHVQLTDTEQHLQQALEALSSKDAQSLDLQGLSLERGQVETLLEAHHEMQEMFEDDLNIIEGRTDERK
jgi:hypothetical protein